MVACIGWECVADDNPFFNAATEAAGSSSTTQAATTTAQATTTAAAQVTTTTPAATTSQQQTTTMQATSAKTTLSSSKSSSSSSKSSTTSISSSSTSVTSTNSPSVTISTLADNNSVTVTIIHSGPTTADSSTTALATSTSQVASATGGSGISHTVIYALSAALGSLFLLVIIILFFLWRRGKLRGLCCGRRNSNEAAQGEGAHPYMENREESRMLEIGNGQIRTPVVSIHSGWNRDRRWLCGSTDSLGTLVSQLTLTEYMETQRNHSARTKGAQFEETEISGGIGSEVALVPGPTLTEVSQTQTSPTATIPQPDPNSSESDTPNSRTVFVSRSTAPPSYRSSGSGLSPRYSALASSYPGTFLNFSTSPSTDPFSPISS